MPPNLTIPPSPLRGWLAGEVWKLPLMGPRDGFVHRSLYRTNHHYGIGYCLLNRRRS